MIQDHSDHGASKERRNLCPEWIHAAVPLMLHDSSDLGSLTDPDPDHPKGTLPKSTHVKSLKICFFSFSKRKETPLTLTH